MRVNCYAEELSGELQLTKAETSSNMFYGVRFFLQSPDILHRTAGDDDRSAVTFWVPWTKAQGHQPQVLIDSFRAAIDILENLPS